MPDALEESIEVKVGLARDDDGVGFPSDSVDFFQRNGVNLVVAAKEGVSLVKGEERRRQESAPVETRYVFSVSEHDVDELVGGDLGGAKGKQAPSTASDRKCTSSRIMTSMLCI